jgi:signal peptidase I
VALPGDTVEIRHGALYVNSRQVEESYVASRFKDDDSYPPTEVKRGYYFVLGDHRNSSNDSRNWGDVPEKYIYGKAMFRFWPLSKLGPIE